MFFYDAELQLHINDEPLLISSKIQREAKNLGIDLKWDQNGYIHQLSYNEMKLLSSKLNIVMLSVCQFMNLAKREPRVASKRFAEWLDDTYTLLPDQRMMTANGKILDVPMSRPGWFELDSVGTDGLPTKLSFSSGAGKWKFWTPADDSFKAAAVRSFVTSSGTCSLDLGIPSFARHPNVKIRECYQSRPAPIDNPMDRIWVEYERKTFGRNNEEILNFFKSLDMDKLSLPANALDGFLFEKNQERIIDLAGKKRLIEGNFADLRTINLGTVALALASRVGDDTTFVTGNEHPDADAVVSAAFEAVRRHIYYGKSCVAWVQKVPLVVRHILGPELCDILVKTPKFGSTNDIVLVDCHSIGEGREYQVKAIIDHHIIARTFPHYVSISQEVSWSSTIQVYIKFLGSGLDLDSKTARMLLEATLVEAEPSLMERMSQVDRMALDRLKALAQGSQSYPDLMKLLARDTMSSDPFMMDYKEGLFGFSVIKCQEATSYASQAKANNIQRHLPLTIVKQVVYDANFQNVVQEHLSMYFNDKFHDKGFRKAILDTILTACKAMHGPTKVSSKDCEVEITNVPHQTPRLLLAPLLEPIVKEHLRFFRSKAIGMYMACGFYTEEQGEYGHANEQPSVKTGITFEDVKALLSGQSETSFMNLPQYWRVYRECSELRDAVTLKSLRDPSYVELLDTSIYNGTEVEQGNHKRIRATILEAKPALIRPEDINAETGFPDRLVSPDTYSDNSLWRYWSPDRDQNVATRGHIFVMDQTCIDLKVGRHEKTQQLTFRPIYRDIPELKYEIQLTEDGKWATIMVFPRLFSIRSESVPGYHQLTKLIHGLA